MGLKIGDKVPEFEAVIQDGSSIKLSDYLGKKLVIYFYPKDNTPGCTAESCDLRDNYNMFLDKGYEILGVSTDTEKSHVKFIDKYELPFNLIADTDKTVHEIFGVWRLKKMYGREYMGTVRTTFIIDESGNVEDVIEKVKTKEHSAQILKEV